MTTFRIYYYNLFFTTSIAWLHTRSSQYIELLFLAVARLALTSTTVQLKSTLLHMDNVNQS